MDESPGPSRGSFVFLKRSIDFSENLYALDQAPNRLPQMLTLVWQSPQRRPGGRCRQGAITKSRADEETKMNKILIAGGATLLAATTLLAPAAGATFNLQIDGAPSRVAHTVRCCGQAGVQVRASALNQDDDSWEEHEDRLEAVADNESDDGDEREESCDEGEQASSLKQANTAPRGKFAPSVRSSVTPAKQTTGPIRIDSATTIEAKTRPIDAKTDAVRTVEARTVEDKAAQPEKSRKTEKAERAESARSSEKREVAAAAEGNGECKRFVPAVGMTVSVHCE
jgi:hypothetical protein